MFGLFIVMKFGPPVNYVLLLLSKSIGRIQNPSIKFLIKILRKKILNKIRVGLLITMKKVDTHAIK